jgi:hypothetical protein
MVLCNFSALLVLLIALSFHTLKTPKSTSLWAAIFINLVLIFYGIFAYLIPLKTFHFKKPLSFFGFMHYLFNFNLKIFVLYILYIGWIALIIYSVGRLWTRSNLRKAFNLFLISTGIKEESPLEIKKTPLNLQMPDLSSWSPTEGTDGKSRQS